MSRILIKKGKPPDPKKFVGAIIILILIEMYIKLKNIMRQKLKM